MLDLRPTELQEVQHILQKHLPNTTVLAFGSRVEGRAKPYSDLDLAVIEQAAITDQVWTELLADFEDSNLPFRVDLLNWKDLPAQMQQSILQHAIPITNQAGRIEDV